MEEGDVDDEDYMLELLFTANSDAISNTITSKKKDIVDNAVLAVLLPFDILVTVLSLSSPNDINSFSCACTYFHNIICKDEPFWRAVCIHSGYSFGTDGHPARCGTDIGDEGVDDA
jgi:hypothetical protein